MSARRASTRWLHNVSGSHAVVHPRCSAPERHDFGDSDRVNGCSDHTAVAWTPVIEAGAGDGDGVGDGVDEGADDAGGEDGDPAVADGVGARAAGRQALAVRLSAAKIATNVGPRRTVRL